MFIVYQASQRCIGRGPSKCSALLVIPNIQLLERGHIGAILKFEQAEKAGLSGAIMVGCSVVLYLDGCYRGTDDLSGGL